MIFYTDPCVNIQKTGNYRTKHNFNIYKFKTCYYLFICLSRSFTVLLFSFFFNTSKLSFIYVAHLIKGLHTTFCTALSLWISTYQEKPGYGLIQKSETCSNIISFLLLNYLLIIICLFHFYYACLCLFDIVHFY